MSYCRWSSDDWKSDIYCYEGEDGYHVHVAASRIVGDVPKIDWSSPEVLYETYKKQMEFMDNAERKNIGLEYDGESFYFSTPGGCADWLFCLRDAGYNVPQYAIEALQEEEKSLG